MQILSTVRIEKMFVYNSSIELSLPGILGFYYQLTKNYAYKWFSVLDELSLHHYTFFGYRMCRKFFYP